MRLNDLFDFEKGPSALFKVALYPLMLIVICQALTLLVCRISFSGALLALGFLLLLSPLTYFVREARGRGRERTGGRGGAERTPILPTDGEME